MQPPTPPPPSQAPVKFAMSTPHQSFNAVRLDKLIANDEQSTYVWKLKLVFFSAPFSSTTFYTWRRNVSNEKNWARYFEENEKVVKLKN